MTTMKLSGRAPLLTRRSPPKLLSPAVVDLMGLQWATPYDAAVLALVVTRLLERGEELEVFLPDDPEVRAYLVDLGLPAFLPHNAWGAGRSARYPPLIGLTRLMQPEDWDDLLPQLWPAVAQQLHDPPLTHHLFDIVGELVDNATTHGASVTGTFVCAQRYTGGTSGLEAGLWVAVVDGGIGIPDHLRGHRDYIAIRADEELIRLARQPWVTGTSDRRGWGLVEVFREAAAVGISSVVIRAGRGEGRFSLAQGRSPWARYRRLSSRIAGTWVHLQLVSP
jgi:hypothetical protein